MKTLAAVLGALALVLAGCSEPITKGNVCGKKFVQAYDSHSGCPPMVAMTTSHHPDEWYATIQENKAGKEQHKCYSVTKEFYDSTNEGDYLDFSKEK